jgi:hypothetical protein
VAVADELDVLVGHLRSSVTSVLGGELDGAHNTR